MTTLIASWNKEAATPHQHAVYHAYGFTPESARNAQAEDAAINRYLAELMGEPIVLPTPRTTWGMRMRNWTRSHDALCILALLPMAAWAILYACIELM